MPTIPLRAKLLLVLAGLTLTILSGSGITLWYTHQVDTTWSPAVSRDIESFQAAEELLSALVMQKGFVTYYFLKNDQEWLDKLRSHHDSFMSWIHRARETDQGREAHSILNDIETRYLRYAYARDQVIALYKKGHREQGAELHWQVREQFFALADLCRRYKELHRASIAAKTRDLIVSIPGLGIKAVAVLIATTHNFTRFANYKQIIAFVGFSPRVYESGTSVKGKGHICKMGKGKVRKQMYLSAWSAKFHNKSCMELYERLSAKGKPERVIKVAIANKLIKQVFAVVTKNKAYDENHVSVLAIAKP